MTPATSHQAIDEILPWYANGTLSAEERNRVEQHLADCGECRDEVALLEAVVVAASESLEATPAVPDTFGKTMALIDDWERSRSPSVTARLRAFVEGLVQPSRLPRLVLVGQFALILVLGGLLVSSRVQEREFSTLSGGDGATGGVRLTVIFEPTATEEGMRLAVREVGGVVVSGPSAVGVYVVALPVTETDAAAVDAAIATLQGKPAVIRFVERQP